MPALTCDFDEILSSFSPGVKSEKEETFPPPPPHRSFGDDIQVSSTSLESLLGLGEDGVAHAPSGRAERGIVARHLRRALSSKSRLGIGNIVNMTTEDRMDGAETETILLARRRTSTDDVDENSSFSSSSKRDHRRLREISFNGRNHQRPKSESNKGADVSVHADSVLEGTPLAVDFVSLDLPRELLDTPTLTGDGGDFDFDGADAGFDWIEPVSLSAARQMASQFNLSAFYIMNDESHHGSESFLPPPLWIACDGTDDRSVVLSSVQKLGARETLVTTVSSRSVTTIDARAEVDQVLRQCREEEEDDGDDDDEDEDVVERGDHHHPHFRVSAFYLQRMSVLDNDVNETDNFHDFSAAEDPTTTTSSDKAGRRRQMVIEVNSVWDSAVDKRLMQTPAVTDKMSDCRLHLTIGGSPKEDATKLGEGQARILHFYEDMKKLQAFLRGLTSGGRELTWFPESLPEESDEGVVKRPLLKRVEDLLKRERQQPTETAEPSAGGGGAEEGAESGVRLDFVAKLWNLLKFCGSSHELQECLTRAVFGIVNASSIDALPTVFSISSSNVAKRIVATQERLLNGEDLADGGSRKGSYRDDNPLIGLNPLLLLAEIGIDKLRQEYHAFSTNLLPQLSLDKLVSGSSIYGKESKSSKFLDLKDRCLADFHRLVVSHYVVDSLVQIKTFFPSVNLEEAALKMAGGLRKQPPKNMGDFKTISLKISMSEDVKLEQLKNPTSWMMTSTTAEGGVEAFHVSPFKALPIRREEAFNSNNFFLTRVSSSLVRWANE